MVDNMVVRVSVVMAVYNGEKYLTEQIGSILPQLNEADELVISVDPCGDSSKEIALAYASQDARVRVFDGPGSGVVKNFEAALGWAMGAYIFLSDQDDVWLDGKVEKVLCGLEREGVLAVVHNASIVEESLVPVKRRFFEQEFNPSLLRNIVKNRYIGCCMAVRWELMNMALPFPDDIPMHDQWLGLLAKRHGEVKYIDEPLMLYRRHGDTVTGRKKADMLTKARWRCRIITQLITRNRKLKHGSN